MARKARYEVTAALIVVQVPGAQGGEVYMSRGQLLPATVAADEVKRLASLGLVEKADVSDSSEGTSEVVPSETATEFEPSGK